MPEFEYTAIAKTGQRSTATIQAQTVAAAGHLLKEQGLLPLSVSPVKKSSLLASLKQFTTISLDEKIGSVEKNNIPASHIFDLKKIEQLKNMDVSKMKVRKYITIKEISKLIGGRV